MTDVKRRLLAVSLFVVLLVGLAALAGLGLPVVSVLAQIGVIWLVLIAAIWLLYRLFRSFLWKVGRRLAFSYFLIGVLPIPLVLALLVMMSYLLSAFFLGHLARDAMADVEEEMTAAATARLAEYRTAGRPDDPRDDPGGDELSYAYYRDGRRVAGGEWAPESWPDWLTPAENGTGRSNLVLLANTDAPRLLTAAGDGTGPAVLALYAGDFDRLLRERTGFWVEGHYPGEPSMEGRRSPMRLQIGGSRQPVRVFGWDRTTEEAEAFFAERAQGDGWADRPILWWGEISDPVRRLPDGALISEETMFAINATPRSVRRHLFSGNSEVDSAAWAGLLFTAALLANVYLAAVVMAVFLIFGLSRAVNRLSQATQAVQTGDFSARIPVKRRDQVGELQRSFNRMAENLESLVAAQTQKELLEKELAIARDLQQSLLPRSLPEEARVELATLFEPSAAIGGDYYDLFRLRDGRLAVAVADVSGHGLSAGLRMAMLKAALTVLMERSEDPEVILGRLDAMVRAEGDRRFFVTATLALLDPATGRLELVNAGHPPTYLLRNGHVREILLPGPPLGAFTPVFGRGGVDLMPGDVVVWLSDGLLEAQDRTGAPLGYERTKKALAGPGDDAQQVLDRLLAAVAEHTGNAPPTDDRTAVVLRYRESSSPNVE